MTTQWDTCGATRAVDCCAWRVKRASRWSWALTRCPRSSRRRWRCGWRSDCARVAESRRRGSSGCRAPSTARSSGSSASVPCRFGSSRSPSASASSWSRDGRSRPLGRVRRGARRHARSTQRSPDRPNWSHGPPSMDEPAEALRRHGGRAAWRGGRGASMRHLVSMLVRFSLVGLMKTALDFATFNLVLWLAGVEGFVVVLLANTAGFAVSVASSFVLNARYTFRVATVPGGFRRYVLISVIGLVIYNGSLAIILVIADPEGTLALNAAKVGALAASMGWNFLGYWRFVFRPPARERT
ncbi:MAG: hypothetical protein GEU80_01425 [Dehalococcoidia bacterium]|nr:hypothetical protein [Dehalococcoidia bacterium]